MAFVSSFVSYLDPFDRILNFSFCEFVVQKYQICSDFLSHILLTVYSLSRALLAARGENCDHKPKLLMHFLHEKRGLVAIKIETFSCTQFVVACFTVFIIETFMNIHEKEAT